MNCRFINFDRTVSMTVVLSLSLSLSPLSLNIIGESAPRDIFQDVHSDGRLLPRKGHFVLFSQLHPRPGELGKSRSFFSSEKAVMPIND